MTKTNILAVILGSSYCSGFVDSSGRWNQGFYCPETEELSSVFCCGDMSDKYCCTKVTQTSQRSRLLCVLLQADLRIMDDGERFVVRMLCSVL